MNARMLLHGMTGTEHPPSSKSACAAILQISGTNVLFLVTAGCCGPRYDIDTGLMLSNFQLS